MALDAHSHWKEKGVGCIQDLERYIRGLTASSGKKRQRQLEESLVEEVRQAFTAWRSLEDEKLLKAFEDASRRFIVRIDDTVDALLKFSAELFSVPFDTVKAEALWSAKSRFHYKFRENVAGEHLSIDQ